MSVSLDQLTKDATLLAQTAQAALGAADETSDELISLGYTIAAGIYAAAAVNARCAEAICERLERFYTEVDQCPPS